MNVFSQNALAFNCGLIVFRTLVWRSVMPAAVSHKQRAPTRN